MKWTDGNLLVTMAIVFGGFGCAASASRACSGTSFAGSGPSDQVGNCASYLARLGMPNVWWIEHLVVALRDAHRREDRAGRVRAHQQVDLVDGDRAARTACARGPASTGRP